ncbi:MAG: orotate phosphoribosyltransferase [Pyrinomonadaceae bacterium]
MDDVLQHFRDRGALLEGHFILSSGLHSPKYLQCALAIEKSGDATSYGEAIARHFRDHSIQTVASPAIGGLVIGFAVAQALGTRFIWTERQDGKMTLRRGFSVDAGERILVVEDVITTGGSTRECIAALEINGGGVVAAASIIDRSDGTADVGVERISLARLAIPTYRSEDCPMCGHGDTAVKPGSRSLK